MARAKAAISFANAGSSAAGRLKPCRSALRAERALPAGVFGPPKSDLSDFGQLKVPNSGKPEFGGHGAAREYLLNSRRVQHP
jgi:hypothetical protein